MGRQDLNVQQKIECEVEAWIQVVQDSDNKPEGPIKSKEHPDCLSDY
jgi:hypothetical protein